MLQIGELINKFDEADEQTVKTFNNLFKHCQLLNTADYTFFDTDRIEIGEPYAAGLRMITVNEKYHFYHEMKIPLEEECFEVGKKVEIFNESGESLGKFGSSVEARFHLGMSHSQFYYYLKQGVISKKEIIVEVE